MSEPTTKYGILVAVDGSAESDAAVRWATREAVLHDAPLTLAHVVMPVVVSWPVASLQGSYNEWQEQNAQQVIEQAQKTLHASLGEAQPPAVHTKVLHDYIVPALVDASKEAQMVVVGSRGMGAIGRTLLGSVSSGWCTTRMAPSRSSTPTKRRHLITPHRSCWVSTVHRPRRPPRPWLSMKHRAGEWN